MKGESVLTIVTCVTEALWKLNALTVQHNLKKPAVRTGKGPFKCYVTLFSGKLDTPPPTPL